MRDDIIFPQVHCVFQDANTIQSAASFNAAKISLPLKIAQAKTRVRLLVFHVKQGGDWKPLNPAGTTYPPSNDAYGQWRRILVDRPPALSVLKFWVGFQVDQAYGPSRFSVTVDNSGSMTESDVQPQVDQLLDWVRTLPTQQAGHADQIWQVPASQPDGFTDENWLGALQAQINTTLESP